MYSDHSDLAVGGVVGLVRVGLAIVDIVAEEGVATGVAGGVAEIPKPMTVDLIVQEIAVGVHDGFLALQ